MVYHVFTYNLNFILNDNWREHVYILIYRNVCFSPHTNVNNTEVPTTLEAVLTTTSSLLLWRWLITNHIHIENARILSNEAQRYN